MNNDNFNIEEWEQFDLERWNKDIPVRTASFRSVRILCTDKKVTEKGFNCKPIVGAVTYNDGDVYMESIQTWHSNGIFPSNKCPDSFPEMTLMMKIV